VSLSSGIVTLWLRGTDDVGCSGGQLPCLRDGLGDDLATSEQREDREQAPPAENGASPVFVVCVSAWIMWPRSTRALRATASLDSSSTSPRGAAASAVQGARDRPDDLVRQRPHPARNFGMIGDVLQSFLDRLQRHAQLVDIVLTGVRTTARGTEFRWRSDTSSADRGVGAVPFRHVRTACRPEPCSMRRQCQRPAEAYDVAGAGDIAGDGAHQHPDSRHADSRTAARTTKTSAGQAMPLRPAPRSLSVRAARHDDRDC